MSDDIVCGALNKQVAVGIAQIKKQYVFHGEPTMDSTSESGAPKAKKPKQEKRKRGQNKNRYNYNKNDGDNNLKLCSTLVDVTDENNLPSCNYPDCKNLHNVKQYLLLKPPDLGKDCHVYLTTGHCPRGVTCRFASNHINENGINKINAELSIKNCNKTKVILSKEIQTQLRKKKYDFTKAHSAIDNMVKAMSKMDEANKEIEKIDVNDCDIKISCPKNVVSADIGPICHVENTNQREIKTIKWADKLYLSPLTTLGNLPFRRICKEWGADITCGEMAMATPILQGVSSEWALLRRHSSEDLFGVQLCGNNPHVLARCAQLIEETTNADFIDLNLGCPIELVYRNGAGSGLLRREKQLELVVRSMSHATRLPLTVKTRTGIYTDKRVAHTLMPLFSAAGAKLITVHGRTREQRYTRHADWTYIDECAKAAAPTPVFGNGDILSFHDYNSVRENYSHVAGVMIGRGALYKPWIFTEIKEQRDWDISSSERFEVLRKFVHHGFEHWGSDTKGVENTRRFLLEWLSFLYRYIPIGLLERPPQKINERPPRYVGRNDLETLMASSNCKDWVTISEMLCGPVPEDFRFLPKHRANAWSSD